MSSRSVPIKTRFLGSLSLLLKWVTTTVLIFFFFFFVFFFLFARNLQLPFLNPWKGKYERRKYFNISWCISTKLCCRTRRKSNPRHPDHQSEAHPTEKPRPAVVKKKIYKKKQNNKKKKTQKKTNKQIKTTRCHKRCLQCDKWPLWKQAYSNILKISPPKTESFQIKILIFFIFLL